MFLLTNYRPYYLSLKRSFRDFFPVLSKRVPSFMSPRTPKSTPYFFSMVETSVSERLARSGPLSLRERYPFMPGASGAAIFEVGDYSHLPLTHCRILKGCQRSSSASRRARPSLACEDNRFAEKVAPKAWPFLFYFIAADVIRTMWTAQIPYFEHGSYESGHAK